MGSYILKPVHMLFGYPLETVFLFALILLFLIAGMSHFVLPKVFLNIMPPWTEPRKKELNILVGIAELAVGVGLILAETRTPAGIGAILILIAVFPAHVYMLQNPKVNYGLPEWLLWARLPIQGILIGLVIWTAL